MDAIKENYDKFRKHKEKTPQATDWGTEIEQPRLNIVENVVSAFAEGRTSGGHAPGADKRKTFFHA